MKKVAIITDTHFGARGEAEIFLEAKAKMLKEFFAFVKKNKITEIWHLGDIVDSRKSMSSKLLRWINTHWTQPIHDLGLTVVIIVGNHDTYYRSLNTPNTVDELYGRDSHFKIVTSDVYVSSIGGNSVAFVPWLSPENEKRCLGNLNKNMYDVVCGHFDIIGSLMLGSTISEHGLNKDTFKHNRLVLSGHYHKRSINENIYYLGSPVPINWAESIDSHGWHTLDENLNLKFHEFKYPLYKRITINTDGPIDEPYEGHSFYKINIIKKNEFFFQQWLNELKQHKILQLQIIEDGNDSIDETVEIDENEIREDLLGLMSKAIDQSAFERGVELKNLLSELHNEIVNSRLVVKG